MDLTLSPHLQKYSKHYDIKKASSFSRELNSKSRRKKYSKNIPDFHIHRGQRKLLLSEMEFIINEFNKLDVKEKKIILYIGASTGVNSVHTYTLSRMFPEFEFDLYDDNDFYPKLYDLKNVKIFKRWFTQEDSVKYNNKNLLLISDIRNPDIGIYKKNKNIKGMNQIILEDINFQKKICEDINPKSSLLKFRLPWDDKKTEYFDGKIYYQCWEGSESTETRLVPNKVRDGRAMKLYDNRAYEERLYYFNTETRMRYYPHKYDCYGHCYDCRSEIDILEKFVKFCNSSNSCNIKGNKSKLGVCDLGRQISKELSQCEDKNFCKDKNLFQHPPMNKYKI